MVAALAATAVATSSSATSPVVAQSDQPIVVSEPLTNPASKFIPINPVRVVDTRFDPAIKRLWNESAFSIDPVTDTGVAARAGVDAGQVTAVVVNTTYVNAGGIGFGTVWPTGGERPFTSTNNLDFVGHTAPNLVIAPLGLDQKISAYASANSDVIIDVLGVFVQSDATSDGRFTALAPVRALDTREPGVPDLDAGISRTYDLRPFGVPADATAVVMNLTSVNARGSGFYRVWPADEAEPAHSNVNVLAPNTDTGNQVISGVDDGRVSILSSAGGGMTIDITGYFTGDSADVTTEGLFVPFSPGRLLDTREASGPTGLNGGQRLGVFENFDLQIDGRLDIPDGAAKAVALNLTATGPARSGFVKAYATGSAIPPTSSLNTSRADQTVPNHAITSILPSDGRVRFRASLPTHLVVDATGYFLAPGAAPPAGGAAVDKTVDPGSFDPDPLGSRPALGPYDFLFDRSLFQSNGVRPNPTVRIAWRVCGPNPVLRYALNIDLAQNDEQIAALITSIEAVEVHSGVDFQFGGVTSAGMNVDAQNLVPRQNEPYTYLPPDDDGTGVVDLVIGFTNGSDTPSLGPGIIGRGGSVFLPPDANGIADSLIGFAAMDVEELVASNGGPSTQRTLEAIRGTTRHELGHLMGLAHVDEGTPTLEGSFSSSVLRDQLMYPSIQFGPGAPEIDFNTGDIRGLWELYANQPGCGAGKPSGAEVDPRDGVDFEQAMIASDH